MHRFAGRTGVVTGAGRGIGRAIAARLADEGACVFGLDLDASGLEASGPPGADGPGTIGLACDCSDEASVAAALERIPGPIHVLVNNAGVGSFRSVVETSPTDWDAVLRANLRSAFVVSRAVVPRMAEDGAIVHIASILGLTGAAAAAAYSASKAGILGLGRAMARDLAPAIRVNCVCPGAVDTDMLRAWAERGLDPEAETARIVAGIPLGRIGRPADVAGAVAFLASEDAAWITGATLVVDGGDSA